MSAESTLKSGPAPLAAAEELAARVAAELAATLCLLATAELTIGVADPEAACVVAATRVDVAIEAVPVAMTN